MVSAESGFLLRSVKHDNWKSTLLVKWLFTADCDSDLEYDLWSQNVWVGIQC